MIEKSEHNHFVVQLVPNKFNTRLDFKGLYVRNPNSKGPQDILKKIYGKSGISSPAEISQTMIKKCYKFSGQTKEFGELIGVIQITSMTDAIQLKSHNIASAALAFAKR